MSLAAPVEDPLRRLWGPVTIRVAWELLRRGVSPRPATLKAVRAHALWRLPAQVDLAGAEARTVYAVEEYVARLGGDYRPVVVDADVDLLPDPAWRQAALDAMEPVQEAIFRMHFGDGEPFEALVERLRLPPVTGRAAREAVRDVIREVVGAGGLVTAGWDPARLDRLVGRVANAATDNCPGPGGLATELGRAHADACPRCGRALRLMREGVLAPSDLFAPEGAHCLPDPDLDLAVVQIHVDARRHRKALATTLPDAFRLDDDTFVVTGEGLYDRLLPLAEAGTPPAAMLRIARGTVAGQMTQRLITGPGIDELLGEARALPWGEVRGMEALPAPEPGPPSAARWWAAAALLAMLAVAAGLYVGREGGAPAEVPLAAEVVATGVGFTTDPSAYVDVIAVTGVPTAVEFHSKAAGDKGSLATGDGKYVLSSSASSWVVVASRTPLDDLDDVAGAAKSREDLLDRIRARYPHAAVAVVP